jgi:hypothetical protein
LLPPVDVEKLMLVCGVNCIVWSSVVTTTETVGPFPGGVSVYVPVATALVEKAGPAAIASIVVVAAEIVIAPEYFVDEVVGVVPSVV